MRADTDFDWRVDSLPLYKSSEARVGVGHQTTAFAEPKLSVLAANHRPLILRYVVMTDGRIAADDDHVGSECAFAEQLAAAILCENDLHGLSVEIEIIFH